MGVRRQPKCRLRFLLELQVQRRQCRAEAERSCCEQHVLNRRIDRRPRRAGRGAAFEARDNPDGSLMNCAARYSAASSSRRNHHRCMLPPLGALTRAIARVKSRSQNQIALVCQRLEPDTAAMLAKSIASTENCFCTSEKPIEGLLGALAKITPQFKGIGRFSDG